MAKVNLVIEDKNWKSRYPKVNLVLTKSIKKILLSIFPSRTIAFEISILLTGTKNMKKLNKKFDDKNYGSNNDIVREILFMKNLRDV